MVQDKIVEQAVQSPDVSGETREKMLTTSDISSTVPDGGLPLAPQSPGSSWKTKEKINDLMPKLYSPEWWSPLGTSKSRLLKYGDYSQDDDDNFVRMYTPDW